MRFRVGPPWPLLAAHRHHPRPHQPGRRPPSRRIHASANSGRSGASQGNFLLPGATAAVLVMLGALHARRMYDDKKVVDRKEKGIEPEFSPDIKASFFRLLPLRSMSRFWGSLMELEVPVFMRPTIYKAWARAFHSVSKKDQGLLNKVSPVDGKVLQLGELRGPGTMIEQVKGFSYSVSSLLGTSSSLRDAAKEDFSMDHIEHNIPENSNTKSWWRVSVASPKIRDQTLFSPKKGIFYCVIYLHPGDYHRVHSPVDWNILKRRHFSGHLFLQNERAVRTIRNLYVETKRLFIEPELRTNRAGSRMLQSQPCEERVYAPEGTGAMVEKGEEIAGFNMGSTVVVVFEAPVVSKARGDGGTISSSDFNFCVRAGDKIRVGEAIGRWRG